MSREIFEAFEKAGGRVFSRGNIQVEGASPEIGSGIGFRMRLLSRMEGR
jgi:hypothetical protein